MCKHLHIWSHHCLQSEQSWSDASQHAYSRTSEAVDQSPVRDWNQAIITAPVTTVPDTGTLVHWW